MTAKSLHPGQEIGLTAKEFEVLELLMLNPDKVYSRENLLKLVWGTDYPVMCVQWMYISGDCVRRSSPIPASPDTCIPNGVSGTTLIISETMRTGKDKRK